MFTLDGVRKLHGWTHASLNLVLDHLSTMSTNDYVTELSGFGFRTLHEQAVHIFNCEGFGFTPCRDCGMTTGPLRNARLLPM